MFTRKKTKPKYERSKVAYPCLECGMLIQYSWFPCLWCGFYPTTIEELASYDILCSQNQSLVAIFAVSKLIQAKETFDYGIPKWNELHQTFVDSIKNDKSYEFFPWSGYTESFVNERLERVNIRCSNCDAPQIMTGGITSECLNCNQNPNLSETQCWIVAIEGLLKFLCTYDFTVPSESNENFVNLVFYLIRTLNSFVEDEYSISKEGQERITELLGELSCIQAPSLSIELRISPDSELPVAVSAYKGYTPEGEGLALVQCCNLNYLLLGESIVRLKGAE